MKYRGIEYQPPVPVGTYAVEGEYLVQYRGQKIFQKRWKYIPEKSLEVNLSYRGVRYKFGSASTELEMASV
jgi:hypothetical protein